jgi:hypothetical protein
VFGSHLRRMGDLWLYMVLVGIYSAFRLYQYYAKRIRQAAKGI